MRRFLLLLLKIVTLKQDPLFPSEKQGKRICPTKSEYRNQEQVLIPQKLHRDVYLEPSDVRCVLRAVLERDAERQIAVLGWSSTNANRLNIHEALTSSTKRM